MHSQHIREVAQKVINKDKWWDTLSRFIEVLRINLCIVDTHGLVLLPPEEGKFGGRLLTDPRLGFDLLLDNADVLDSFEYQGKYMEAVNQYDLHSFLIPMVMEEDKTIAYMIVGPVILNQRLMNEEYLKMAQKYTNRPKKVMEAFNEMRVVSNVMVNSILDLLSEIVKDNIDLSIKKKELEKIKSQKGVLPKEFSDIAQEIYTTVRQDELLATLLDISLKMTNTECGSIMVVDENSKEMTIKVSRGIDSNRIHNTRVKWGEGISGLAAKRNECFVIHGDQCNNRIKPLCQRLDVKHSVVLPLRDRHKVFGVINLHTKIQDEINDNLENLQYLSRLFSSAF